MTSIHVPIHLLSSCAIPKTPKWLFLYWWAKSLESDKTHLTITWESSAWDQSHDIDVDKSQMSFISLIKTFCLGPPRHYQLLGFWGIFSEPATLSLSSRMIKDRWEMGRRWETLKLGNWRRQWGKISINSTENKLAN